MKIILLANNIVGLKVCSYLVKRKENIIALGIHERDSEKHTKEIIAASHLPKSRIFRAHKLRDPVFIAALRAMKPDIILSAFWGYILKKDCISLPSRGCINFHPGYLPYTRGMNPNVWPFIENSPAGVTLHYIDEGIDTGDIIARRKIPIKPADTAGSLYEKTLTEIVQMFIDEWPRIATGTNSRTPQDKTGNTPTFHRAHEVTDLDEIDLDRQYTGRELIQLLKARSYPDRFFSFYRENGKKIYVRLELSLKQELE